MPRNQKWRNNYYVRDIILREEENKEARHSRGCSMVNSVTPVEGDAYSWTVLSSSGDGSSYEVNRINVDEHECYSEKWCDMKCWSCDACREKYNCNCPDYDEKENLCKHIHAVCMFINGYNNQENEDVANRVAALRETRDAGTQTDPPATPSYPIPGTLTQGNSSEAHDLAPGNSTQEMSSDSSDSDGETPERPQGVRLDSKSRILADALEVPRKLLVKYDQLSEPELRRVRVLLKQLRHIVRD